MEGICYVGSCICRQVSHLFARTVHHHLPECFDDLFTGKLFIQFFLQYSEKKQGSVAGDKMCPDPVFSLEVYRSCTEFRLHDSETFLDLPALFVNPDDFRNFHIFQVCTDSIEAVIPFFFSNHSSIKKRHFFCTDFSVLCDEFPFYETVRVILVFRALFVFPAVDQSLCPFHLPLAYVLLISLIFQGKRYNEVLFQWFGALVKLSAGEVFFHPPVFIKYFIEVFIRQVLQAVLFIISG